MSERPYVIDEMISAKAIAARIEELCIAIREEFRDTDKLVVVGLLRGSFVFIADLVREIDLPVEAARQPGRLKTIALRDKPSRREVDFAADWIGFSIPDEFVVGYGIDYAQRNRNLPFIGKVRFPEA
mgnify:CR=1 FL=1